MITANSALEALANQAVNAAQPPQCLPDPERLAQLANRYFQVWPNPAQSHVGPVSAAVPALTALQSVPPGFGRRPGIDSEVLPDSVQIHAAVTPPLPNVFPISAVTAPAGGDACKPTDVDALELAAFAAKGLACASVFEAALKSDSTRSRQAGGYYFLAETGTGQINSPGPAGVYPSFDVQAVRRDFPILAERVNGYPLVWLDNAATTQKPQAVIDRLATFYRRENSNIHRAAHELAARATDAYEQARTGVARFLHAASADEVVFVRGSTEAINLVAQTWGREQVQAGDEIVVSWLEHHANIVPWQLLCAQTGAQLRVIPVDDDGQILLSDYQKLLNSRTKLVSFTHVSNALGTITPAAEMIALAHRVGARVLLDAAQSVSHLPVDVQSLDCDWLVFSGHKIFGPTGIGVLYGKAELLEGMPPWQGGGNMIADVTFEQTRYQSAPARFEAGTGNIADAVGLAAALDYVSQLGLANIARYEHQLLDYALHALRTVPGLRLIGTAAEKTSVLSFVLPGHDPLEVGKALNRVGIAVRAGHHCAQPILRRFGLEATVRPSLAFYNTYDEIDRLVAQVKALQCGSRRV
ncbi:family 2A encapsulin nanocompartment cargo protein cysteine desulfurase [Methylomonas sp. HYX-M1]|uniref:family 2A encapsulin nanocompartment cargo protein cysteine desulfurase n=1 Tax=Methylomonas sp. HYX-M1 TaxID=3139307 RepID=UPI00345BD183